MDKLHLTAQQESQLQSARKDILSKRRTIQSDRQLSDSQKKEHLMDLRKERKRKMKEILTSDQIREIKKSHRAQRKKYRQSDMNYKRKRIIERIESGSQF